MFHSEATYASDVLKGKSKNATHQLVIPLDIDTGAQYKKLHVNPHMFSAHGRYAA